LDCNVSLALRFTQLMIGLVAYGVAIALMVRAEIGISPWDVLSQGLSQTTGVDFGIMTIIVGAVVLMLWIPLRQKPGIGTILNIIFVGASAQVVLWLMPVQTDLVLRIALFVAGISLLAIATGAYIGANFGPGPRDGLMTGLRARTGWPIWIIRTGIEVIVVTIGWLLGGNVGIGTLVFALAIGPMVHVTMRWFAPRPPRRRPSTEAVAA